MISAFGIDHGDISKGRVWNAVKEDLDLNHRSDRSMKMKGTKDYAKMYRKKSAVAALRNKKNC
jgi:hypothetical protein